MKSDAITIRQLELLEEEESQVRIHPSLSVKFGKDGVLLSDPKGHNYIFSSESEITIIKVAATRCHSVSILRQQFELAVGFNEHNFGTTLRQLVAHGVLQVQSSSSYQLANLDFERFKCQLAYFDDYNSIDIDSQRMQEKLFSAKIAVIGLGGLGGMIAQIMLASGVRSLDLIDGDAIELSNLPRQFLFSESDLGKKKANTLAKRLRAFDKSAIVRPVCKYIVSEKLARNLIKKGKYDLVFICADTPSINISTWIGKICLETKTPYIGMAGPWIGPLYIPGRSPCYVCQSRFNSREFSDIHNYVSEHLGAMPSCIRPSFSAGPTLTASLVATVGIEYLSNINIDRLVSTRLFLDIHGNKHTVEMVSYADCPNCGIGLVQE